MRCGGGCADETPLQTPCRAPAASTQGRPAIVPLLWQGSSPFEYRGLETESDDDETPRGLSAVSMIGQHQGRILSMPALHSQSNAPPLLKRDVVRDAHSQVILCHQCQIR